MPAHRVLLTCGEAEELSPAARVTHPLRFPHRCSQEPCRALTSRIAAHDRENLTRNVAGAARRCHEHEGRGDLLGLRGSLHGRIGVPVRGVERSPHRPRRNRVDANAAIDEMRRKRAGKGMNSTLRQRVVEKVLVPFDAGH